MPAGFCIFAFYSIHWYHSSEVLCMAPSVSLLGPLSSVCFTEGVFCSFNLY